MSESDRPRDDDGHGVLETWDTVIHSNCEATRRDLV